MTSACVKYKTGVDAQDSIILSYPGGKTATIHTGMLAATEQYGIVYGTEGYLIAYNINNIDRIEIFTPDRKLKERIDIPPQITGYEYEVLSCKRLWRRDALNARKCLTVKP